MGHWPVSLCTEYFHTRTSVEQSLTGGTLSGVLTPYTVPTEHIVYRTDVHGAVLRTWRLSVVVLFEQRDSLPIPHNTQAGYYWPAMTTWSFIP